jgi:uncharacterized protein YjiS (DUF1127 family)
MDDVADTVVFCLESNAVAKVTWELAHPQVFALGELVDRNDHLLADIGLSGEQARREAGKPFWVFSKRARCT